MSIALPAYTKIRKPDLDAVAQLSEMGLGGNKQAGNIVLITKVAMISLLHTLLPRWFDRYALFQIGDPNIPYSRIWQQMKIQEK